LTMILIEETIREATIPADAERDTVVMGWEERRRARQRLHTVKGREIAIALPTGTVLTDGDILYVDETFYVSVEAEKEDVLVVPLADATSSAALAYELGNRHLPVSIGHGLLATPYDRLIDEMLAESGLRYERRKEPFEAVRVLHHHG
jgi:urease accessory protein